MQFSRPITLFYSCLWPVSTHPVVCCVCIPCLSSSFLILYKFVNILYDSLGGTERAPGPAKQVCRRELEGAQTNLLHLILPTPHLIRPIPMHYLPPPQYQADRAGGASTGVWRYVGPAVGSPTGSPWQRSDASVALAQRVCPVLMLDADPDSNSDFTF